MVNRVNPRTINTTTVIYVGCQVLAGDLGIDINDYDLDVSLDDYCEIIERKIRTAMTLKWSRRALSPEVVIKMDRGYRLSGESMAPNVFRPEMGAESAQDSWYAELANHRRSDHANREARR